MGCMALQIYLLGQFKLKTDDQRIDLPVRSAQSLLAFLVINAGIKHRRERLASLLWPETSEENARSYLRQALWRIRKALESGVLSPEDYLQINDVEVLFDEHSDYWLDVQVLLGSIDNLSVEQIINIVGLYRGELLPGFYEDWVMMERDRLQAAYHQKMNLLLEKLIQGERWNEAVQWAEQWIRLDNAPEPAFRMLMYAHAGLGDSSMASAAYQRCVESLKRDLNLEPSNETRQLFEQIRKGSFQIPVKPVVVVESPGILPPFFKTVPVEVEKPIFAAREGELAQLEGFLESALAGQGRAVFVTGEAGSGKTALLHEFSRNAQEKCEDLIVASGTCNAYTGIGDPYLPFREILGMLTGDIEAWWAAGAISRDHALRLWKVLPLSAQALVEVGCDLIGTFVPHAALLERAVMDIPGKPGWVSQLNDMVVRKNVSYSTPVSQQSDLFEQYTRVLLYVSRQVPLILLIDDLQWADAGSINLLFHLGRRLTGSRVLIIGSFRPEEVAIGRDGTRHPLDSVLNELQRDFGDIILNLGQAENRALMEALLDSEPNLLETSFRDMLYRQTAGHPLFTIELLRGLQERGDLVRDSNGCWVEGPSLDWETLPARIEAVIAERIGRLPPALLLLLQVACVEGEMFTAEVVGKVRAVDIQEVLRSLSGELDRRHRLVSAQSILRFGGNLFSRYRFRHILFQRFLYGSLDEVERVHLHEMVGNALEELYCGQMENIETASVVVQLALHFQRAWVNEKAIHYLQKAGERAIQLSAFKEAVTHLNNGLALLASLPDSLDRAREELALQVSIGIAWKSDIPDSKGEKALARARELCVQMDMKAPLVRVLGELSIFPYVRAEYRASLELAEEALCVAQETGDELLEMLAHWHMGFVLFALGDFDPSRIHLEKIISFYKPQEHHRIFVELRGSDAGVSALAYYACCMWCLGYPEQALWYSQQSVELAYRLSHAFSLADVLCYGGCVFNSMRRDVDALEESAEALYRISKEKGFSSFWSTGMSYRGEVMTRRGNFQEGISLLLEGIAIRALSKARCSFSVIMSSLAQAQIMSGHLETGLTTFSEVFPLVEETGERFYEAELYRQQAAFQLKQGQQRAAEASLWHAVEIARHQKAKSWELRALIDLAHLNQGGIGEEKALRELSAVYSWFREGFNTPDLQEAQALLDAHKGEESRVLI